MEKLGGGGSWGAGMRPKKAYISKTTEKVKKVHE